jgi:hypothetical protein
MLSPHSEHPGASGVGTNVGHGHGHSHAHGPSMRFQETIPRFYLSDKDERAEQRRRAAERAAQEAEARQTRAELARFDAQVAGGGKGRGA